MFHFFRHVIKHLYILIFFFFFGFPFVFRHSEISFLAFLWTFKTKWALFLSPSWLNGFAPKVELCVKLRGKNPVWVTSEVGIWGLTCGCFMIYARHSLEEALPQCSRKLTWNVPESFGVWILPPDECSLPRGRVVPGPVTAKLCRPRKPANSATPWVSSSFLFSFLPWHFFWGAGGMCLVGLSFISPKTFSGTFQRYGAPTLHIEDSSGHAPRLGLLPAHLLTRWSSLWPGMVGERLRWGPGCNLVALWEAPKPWRGCCTSRWTPSLCAQLSWSRGGRTACRWIAVGPEHYNASASRHWGGLIIFFIR